MFIEKIISTFLTDIIKFFLGLLTSIIVYRLLGPSLMGKYILVITASTTVVNLLNMGLNISNSVFAAEDRSKAGILFTHSIIISLVVGGLGIIIFFLLKDLFLSLIFKNIEPMLIFLAFLSIPFALYGSYWGAIMVGLQEISLINKSNLIGSISSLLIPIIVLYIFGLGLKEFLIFNLIYNIFWAFVLGIILFKKEKGIRFSIDYPFLKKSVSFGFKGHLGNIAHFFFLRIDYFIVNNLLGAEFLGYYGLATSIAEKLWMFVGPVYSVVFAKITNLPISDSINLITKILRNIIFILMALSALLSVTSYWLIKFLYGKEFLPAVVPLNLLLPGAISLGASWFLSLFFIGKLKKPEVTTVIGWVGLSISIPLYFGLTKLFGTSGSAAASSLTYVFIFLATLFQFHKVSKLRISELMILKKQDLLQITAFLRDYFDTTRKKIWDFSNP